MSRFQIDVAAVGDLQLGDSPICVGFGFASRHRTPEEFTRAIAAARAWFAHADIVFGNLETVLGPDPDTSSLRDGQLRGRWFYAKTLREVGFTLLHVANNHAVQHGVEAFRASVAAVTREGIACCGLRGSLPWVAEPVRLVMPNGVRVGVLGYCRRPRQYGEGVPPYAEGTDDAILADVKRLRGDVDALLVSLHWGEEFVAQPSVSERKFAVALCAAGADLIVGHHPHVARPVETIGRSVVAYSLGNFVADMIWQDHLRRGLALRCRITDGGTEGLGLAATHIGRDYHVSVEAADSPARVVSPVMALEDEDYERQAGRTVRQQQLAAYRYALMNIGRYGGRVLFDLVTTTLRNKLAGLRRHQP